MKVLWLAAMLHADTWTTSSYERAIKHYAVLEIIARIESNTNEFKSYSTSLLFSNAETCKYLFKLHKCTHVNVTRNVGTASMQSKPFHRTWATWMFTSHEMLKHHRCKQKVSRYVRYLHVYIAWNAETSSTLFAMRGLQYRAKKSLPLRETLC